MTKWGHNMSARIDLTEQQFGRWLALRYIGSRRWLCRCECGVEREIDGSSLRAGRTRGCIDCHTASRPARKHGEKRTRLYNIWSGMIDRCENSNCAAFPRYGGRGISIYSDWRADFTSFRGWAYGNGYADHLTIDRINSYGNYEPGNCRWATYADQNRNYGRNRPIDWDGKTWLVDDLAAHIGMSSKTLRQRIFKYGWTVERAVSEPVWVRSYGGNKPWEKAGMSKSSWYRAGKP